MHDAGDPVKSRFFFLADVAVAFEDDDVAFSFDDAMQNDIAFDVAYEGNCAGADVAVSPWAESYLISQMKQGWIHAVALCSDGYRVAFSN